MTNRSYMMMAAALTALLLSTTLVAQKTTPLKSGSGGSAHVRTEWAIDGASISIGYGRPAMKGRPEPMMMPAEEGSTSQFVTTGCALPLSVVDAR